MELSKYFTKNELKVLGDPADLAAAETNLKAVIADLTTDAEKLKANPEDEGSRHLMGRAVREVAKLNAKVDALQKGVGKLSNSAVVDPSVFYKMGARSVRNMAKSIAEVFNRDMSKGFKLDPQSLVLTLEDTKKVIKGKEYPYRKIVMTVSYVPADGMFPVQPKVLAELAYKAFRR